MPCYTYEGVMPVVDATAFVHPTAVLIGDVHVADDPGHYRLTEHRSQPLQVMSADRSLVEDGRKFGPPARPRRRDRGSP